MLKHVNVSLLSLVGQQKKCTWYILDIPECVYSIKLVIKLYDMFSREVTHEELQQYDMFSSKDEKMIDINNVVLL
jgi:hypothetical protein